MGIPVCMRWLVCGGRTFGDVTDRNHSDIVQREKEALFVIHTLDQLARELSVNYVPDDNWLPTDITIISGGAMGVDDRAIDWAAINWTPCVIYPAEWEKYGKSAGYKRNVQMLEEGKPDLVIAFPGGKGTEMMKQIARKVGIPVKEITYNDSSKEGSGQEDHN